MAPKILSPGGDISSVKAALLAGADEVYLGVSEFNARRRAENIGFEDLEDLVVLARQRGVQIFLTLNTLVTDGEFERIVEVMERAAAAGVSAFIVQDLGLLSVMKKLFPPVDIHGSTQMTVHNRGQIDYLIPKGISRINLARELTLEEIGALTAHAHERNLETEVFVHGAYCISYSGQCYMSSFMGGKSGNRGICFQPCRRLYTSPASPDPQYRLNLKDNNLLAHGEDLARTGVDSLKIEGRIKGFPYVYAVTDAWKKRLTSQKTDRDVGKVFNRGFHGGYAEGHVEPEMFAPSGPGDQSLAYVTEVESYGAKERILRTKTPGLLARDDRIFLFGDRDRFVCSGLITEVLSDRDYRFQIENELKDKIRRNQKILRGGDSRSEGELKRRIDRLTYGKEPLTVRVSGTAGSPLRTVWRTGNREAEVLSALSLERAERAGMTPDSLKKQFARLDNRFLELTSIGSDDLGEDLFLPASELNRIRREALAALFPRSEKALACPDFPRMAEKRGDDRNPFHVLINRAEDYEFLGAQGIAPESLFFEVADPRKYDHNLPCVPWFPAIIHDHLLSGYYDLLDRLPPGIPVVADNLAIAHYAGKSGREWIGGSRLNTVNSFAVQSLGESGASAFILSPELNRTQMGEMLGHAPLPSYCHLFGPVLLMETKQCLIRKDKGCGKAEKDGACYTHCRFSSSMEDERGNSFFLEKRPFRENEIYSGSLLYTPDAVRDLERYPTDFIIDMRRFGFFDPPPERFAFLLERIMAGKVLGESDGGLPLTLGNYTKGLS